jgi:hypothetical protein
MRPLFIFITVLASFKSLGQSKNFLVTTTGDSLYGEIKLKNGSFIINNKKEISADEVTNVYADNFKGTNVVHCNLYLYTDNITDLELGFMSRKVIDTVMVLKEIYTTNKMNLYFGTDNLKSQYYFYKTPLNPKPIQLVVRYYLDGGLTSYAIDRAAYRGEKSRIHVEEDRAFVNQLKAIMGNCENITSSTWDLLDYRVYSLKNLIKKYNGCN